MELLQILQQQILQEVVLRRAPGQEHHQRPALKRDRPQVQALHPQQQVQREQGAQHQQAEAIRRQRQARPQPFKEELQQVQGHLALQQQVQGQARQLVVDHLPERLPEQVVRLLQETDHQYQQVRLLQTVRVLALQRGHKLLMVLAPQHHPLHRQVIVQKMGLQTVAEHLPVTPTVIQREIPQQIDRQFLPRRLQRNPALRVLKPTPK